MILLETVSPKSTIRLPLFTQKEAASIGNISHQIEKIGHCLICRYKMASVPYTMKMSKDLKKAKASRNTSKLDQGFGYCPGADNPTKYSSKMMNSIWGRYNELSVHNFKSLQCGGMVPESFQDSQNMQQTSQQAQQTQQGAYGQSGGVQHVFGDLGSAMSNFVDSLHRY